MDREALRFGVGDRNSSGLGVPGERAGERAVPVRHISVRRERADDRGVYLILGRVVPDKVLEVRGVERGDRLEEDVELDMRDLVRREELGLHLGLGEIREIETLDRLDISRTLPDDMLSNWLSEMSTLEKSIAMALFLFGLFTLGSAKGYTDGAPYLLADAESGEERGEEIVGVDGADEAGEGIGGAADRVRGENEVVRKR